MAFVSVTRVRLRSPLAFLGFVRLALPTVSQARRARGFLGGALLPDRRLTFWTLTVWTDAAAMRAYMLSGDHRAAMPRLLDWSDEASVAHWEQPGDGVPSWEEADRRMRAEGRPSKVRRPSRDHAAMTYPPPRTRLSGPIAPERG